MGKDEVEPPEMKLEGRAEELLRHRRALDVPAGAASAPGRVPGRVLSRLCGLPECEVARVLLERARILVGLELVEPLSREVSVVVEPGDAKVDIAAGLVREAVPAELLGQRETESTQVAADRLELPDESMRVGCSVRTVEQLLEAFEGLRGVDLHRLRRRQDRLCVGMRFLEIPGSAQCRSDLDRCVGSFG